MIGIQNKMFKNNNNNGQTKFDTFLIQSWQLFFSKNWSWPYLFLSGFLEPMLTVYPDWTILRARARPKSPLPTMQIEFGWFPPLFGIFSRLEVELERSDPAPESSPLDLLSNLVKSTLFLLLDHIFWFFCLSSFTSWFFWFCLFIFGQFSREVHPWVGVWLDWEVLRIGGPQSSAKVL